MCEAILRNYLPSLVYCILGNDAMGGDLCSWHFVDHFFGEWQHVAKLYLLGYLFVEEDWAVLDGFVVPVVKVVFKGGFPCFFFKWF